MDKNFKKILVVSSYAPPAIGGPQNLYNLLRDFPKDCYFILTSFYNIDNLSAQKGTWLNGEYIFYDKPSANKEDRISAQEEKTITKKSSLLNKLKHLARRNWLVRNLIGVPIIITQIFWIVRQGKKSIEEKKPDVLLGFSDYGPAMIGTYLLHKISKIPFKLFLFDLYKGNFYPFPGGILSKIFEPKLFKQSEQIIVTNQGTKDFYIKRYGENIREKIKIIHNSAFPEPYIASQQKYQPTPPFSILFTGRIYWPQINAIKNLAQAVEEINDLDLKLDIYCPNPREYLDGIGIKESEKIKISVAPPQDMPRIQSQADILFLPLSWGTKSNDIINTATPGKFTDYLVAGKPMLIHAPASAYLVKYAKENNCAMVVDKNEIEELKKGIRALIKNPDLASQLIQNARKIFFANHDANKNAELFRALFVKD
ncbi:glycosyltransferase [Patescibacteria group bacterium]|nr:glycosyltransferase [Patescibacteria group bacterium]MBU4023148.1 glycosyltransferase [Patescibacteria group bacterium]MBU4162005.1 glycosyltransferase [Patescibacteria group bacterium]